MTDVPLIITVECRAFAYLTPTRDRTSLIRTGRRATTLVPRRLLSAVAGDTFTEVPDEGIVKRYEYAKGQHVLIDPQEIDELKLEAKHTINMVQFVDENEID